MTLPFTTLWQKGKDSERSEVRLRSHSLKVAQHRSSSMDPLPWHLPLYHPDVSLLLETPTEKAMGPSHTGESGYGRPQAR